tara:strand:+ start:934 stop:1107 length:174 start_codon:yes stop_codon:yes gene_type:complete
MSHRGNDQIKEQLCDEVWELSVNELYNWLNKYDKDKLDSLEKIMSSYCDKEFDNRSR